MRVHIVTSIISAQAEHVPEDHYPDMCFSVEPSNQAQLMHISEQTDK